MSDEIFSDDRWYEGPDLVLGRDRGGDHVRGRLTDVSCERYPAWLVDWLTPERARYMRRIPPILPTEARRPTMFMRCVGGTEAIPPPPPGPRWWTTLQWDFTEDNRHVG